MLGGLPPCRTRRNSLHASYAVVADSSGHRPKKRLGQRAFLLNVAVFVRVRITYPWQGELVGVDLSQLEVGIAYHLPPTLAAYLVFMRSAEPVDDEEPDRPETMVYRGAPLPPDVADDMARDTEFIEVFERVCDMSRIVWREPLDFDETRKPPRLPQPEGQKQAATPLTRKGKKAREYSR